MKPALWFVLAFCSLPPARAEQLGVYQHGTVVRMRMADCAFSHHGFMNAVSGSGRAQRPADLCPEYTLVSDKGVFVIVGSSSNQLIPLADVIDFRLHKRELAVRVDDARHDSKFAIREMILRSEWDRLQQHIEDQRRAPLRRTEGTATSRNSD